MGQTVTEIISGSEDFAISPAFWNVETDDEINMSKIKSLVDIVCSDMYSVTKHVVAYCIACVYHHFDFLKQHVHLCNILWSSEVFKS